MKRIKLLGTRRGSISTDRAYEIDGEYIGSVYDYGHGNVHACSGVDDCKVHRCATVRDAYCTLRRIVAGRKQ